MWIDSDQIFSFEQIQKLISYDKDIVSGIYKTENGQNFACVKDWDQEFYKKHGSFYFLAAGGRREPSRPNGGRL